MSWYIDSSAFLKLIFDEAESTALLSFVDEHDTGFFSSRLLATEAGRAVVRAGKPPEVADEKLRRVTLVLPSAATFDRARALSPASLRSLDALHLATALEIGADLEAIVAYDGRLIEAARLAGITTVSPGID